MFLETDVLIVGGGAAGIAASVAAAQEGVLTTLIEKNTYLGGRATASAVGTVCGLYLRSNNPIPKYACSGFVKEFAEKLIETSQLDPKKNREGLFYLPYDPSQFQLLCEDYLTRNKVNLLLNTTLTSIELSESKITEIFVLTENKKSQKIKCKTLIDCTGEASISVAGKFDFLPTGKQQAAAHIFSIEKVEENDEQRLSLNIIRALKKGVKEGKISKGAEGLAVVPGSLRNGKVFLKLALLPDDLENHNDLLAFSTDRINKAADFLANNVLAFRNSEVEFISPEIGFRSGPTPSGRYVLSEEDVLETKKFDDGVANGSWPVEFWNENNKPLMKYFESENYYQIPSRCLISNQATNLYFAGKNISATDFAIASARVMGTCLQTGWAAGKLAAFKALGKEENLAVGLVRKNLVIN